MADLPDIGLADLMLRCEDDGGCLVWQRAVDAGDQPRWSLNNKVWYVRQLLAMVMGLHIRKNHRVRVNCGTPRCVHPDHIFVQSQSEVLRGRKLPVTSIAKNAESNRRRSWVSPEIVAAIRASDETGPVLEARYGLCKGYACVVRSGKRWRNYVTPFQGLGAR